MYPASRPSIRMTEACVVLSPAIPAPETAARARLDRDLPGELGLVVDHVALHVPGIAAIDPYDAGVRRALAGDLGAVDLAQRLDLGGAFRIPRRDIGVLQPPLHRGQVAIF